MRCFELKSRVVVRRDLFRIMNPRLAIFSFADDRVAGLESPGRDRISARETRKALQHPWGKIQKSCFRNLEPSAQAESGAGLATS